MKRCAAGVVMHSGWGVLVVVAEDHGLPQIVDRCRIELLTDEMRNLPRGNQPYHYAKDLPRSEAHPYLEQYRRACEQVGRESLRRVRDALKAHQLQIKHAAVIGSVRTLPALDRILAAHPLIHSAEGQLFREIVSTALESLGIPTLKFPKAELANNTARLSRRIREAVEHAGRQLGPPWTADHKAAAFAAWSCLSQASRVATA